MSKECTVTAPTLILEYESRIRALLGNPAERRFEASGVCIRDGIFHVVFDNVPQLAAIKLSQANEAAQSRMSPLHSIFSGYEDISYDPKSECFYLLIEALKSAPGTYKAWIETYDADLHYLSGGWADFPFKRENKGMEGLAHVYNHGQLYLTGLCEGNRCKAGKAGKKPGQGRVQVFTQEGDDWAHVGTFKLPESVRFEDYSGLDIHGKRVAIISQASSMLWVAKRQEHSWDLVDEGRIYQFPRNHKNNTIYCNIEGVAWLDADHIAVVSDKRKTGQQDRRCRHKDQSLHIFRIP